MLAVALSLKQFQVGEITGSVVERAGLSILGDTQVLTAGAALDDGLRLRSAHCRDWPLPLINAAERNILF